jgi:hypothetical protein
VQDRNTLFGQPEQLRHDTLIPSAKHHNRCRTAESSRDQGLKNYIPTKVILGIIRIVKMENVPHSKRSGYGHQDNLANGAATPGNVNMRQAWA